MMLIEMPIPVEGIEGDLMGRSYCIKWKFSESSRRPTIHTKITSQSVELITPYEYEEALSSPIHEVEKDFLPRQKEIINSKNYLRKFIILNHNFLPTYSVEWWYMSKSNFGHHNMADPFKIIHEDVYKVAFVSKKRGGFKDAFLRIEEATGRLNKELKLVPFNKAKISWRESLKREPYQDFNQPSLQKLRHYKALEPNYFRSIKNNEPDFVNKAVLVSNYYINDFSTDEFWNTIINKFNIKFSDTHNEKMRRQEVFEKRRGMKKKAETFEANDVIKERYFEKQLKKYKNKLNWYELSYNPSLTPALIEKYIDKLNWYELSRNPSLTPTLIEKYIDKLNLPYLSQNPSLTPALIEKYEDKLDWSNLSHNPSLTPALIEKYKDKLDWDYLSQNPALTPALIEKYEYKLHWDRLSLNPSLTPALIEKYEDKLYWDGLSVNPSLTPAFIEKYKDKLYWDRLSRNPALTPALIEKYENKLSWDELSLNPSLTPALIEKYEDKLDWDRLPFNPSLTPALIEKYEDKLYGGRLSQNPSLTPALIEKYKDDLDWDMLSVNPALTPALIEKYKNKLNLNSLSFNPSLTPALIEKYEGELDWDWLSSNPALFGNLHIQKKAEEGKKKRNPLLYGAIIVTICALFKKS